MCRGLAGISLLCRVSYRNAISHLPAALPCPADASAGRSFVPSTSDQINTVDDVGTMPGEHASSVRPSDRQEEAARYQGRPCVVPRSCGDGRLPRCRDQRADADVRIHAHSSWIPHGFHGPLTLCVLTRSNRRPRGGCAHSFVGRFRYHFAYACGIRVRIKLIVGPYPCYPWSIRFAIYLRGVRLGRYDKD